MTFLFFVGKCYRCFKSLWKKRRGIFIKRCSCFFFFFLSFIAGWKNILRVAFSQKLTDFHIDSICNWAKTGSGFPPLCKPLLKLIIFHSNTDSCTDVFSEIHKAVSLCGSLCLCHTNAFTWAFRGYCRMWATVRAVKEDSWQTFRSHYLSPFLEQILLLSQ